MKIATLIVTAAAGALLASGAMAQQPARPNAAATRPMMAARPGMRLVALLSRLNLSPAQKAQVQSILKDARAQAQALRQNTSLNVQQKRAEGRKLAQATRQKVLAVLTPPQKKQLALMMRRANMRANLIDALKALNLTPAQKATIQGIVKDARAKRAAIGQDKSLTPEAKRQQLRALAQGTRQKVLAALNTEQKQKLEQRKARG